MGKNPAFQFYPMDWQRDLDEHPLEIEGAWIRICCRLWWAPQRGRLTLSMERWATILRTDINRANYIVEYLLREKICDGKFEHNDYVTLVSRRIRRDEKERELNMLRQRRFRESKDRNAPVTPHITELSQRSSSSSSSSSSKKDIYIVPEWVPVEAWNSYLEMRKKIRKPLTDYGKKRVIEKLKSLGGDPAAILDQSTMNSWQGIFEVRGDGDGQSRGYIRPGFKREAERFDPELEAGIRKAQELERRRLEKRAAQEAASNPHIPDG